MNIDLVCRNLLPLGVSKHFAALTLACVSGYRTILDFARIWTCKRGKREIKTPLAMHCLR